jgi:periplasmic protein CpxP/Spy
VASSVYFGRFSKDFLNNFITLILFCNNYYNLVLIFQTTKIHKKMKKLILTCAFLTSASMLSFAQSTQTTAAGAQPNAAPQAMPNTQQRPTPEQMAERRAQMYTKQYGLDDKQYKGVYAAELDYTKQIMDFRDKHQQSTAEQRQQMQADRDAKYKAVLTPEQYEKFSAGRPKPGVQQAAPSTAPATNK